MSRLPSPGRPGQGTEAEKARAGRAGQCGAGQSWAGEGGEGRRAGRGRTRKGGSLVFLSILEHSELYSVRPCPALPPATGPRRCPRAEELGDVSQPRLVQVTSHSPGCYGNDENHNENGRPWPWPAHFKDATYCRDSQSIATVTRHATL